MSLSIPKEPKEIKSLMESLRANYLNDPSINWDSSVVWAFNMLPKYLWDAWKDDLKPIGFNWQKFMKLLSYRTDIGVLWYKGILPWRDFIKGVIALIEGPIGTGLVRDRTS